MSEFISNFFGQNKPIVKRKKSIKVSKTNKPNKPASSDKIEFSGVKKSKVEGKKYDAIFIKPNGTEKIVSFGKSDEKDYTQHGDKELKEFFDFKYKSKQNWKDLMHPQALNKWILWDKSSLDKGVASYKKMFKDYKQK